jgi:hypothetical protein
VKTRLVCLVARQSADDAGGVSDPYATEFRNVSCATRSNPPERIVAVPRFQQPYRLSTGNFSMVARVTALPGENPKLPPLPKKPR